MFSLYTAYERGSVQTKGHQAVFFTEH